MFRVWIAILSALAILQAHEQLFQLEARIGAIDTKYENFDQKAYGLAVMMGLKKRWKQLEANVAFRTLQHFGLPSDNPDFFGDDGRSKSYVEKANIAYKRARWRLKIGRMEFDSPHMDSDDIRMLPNRFEGALFSYENRFHIELAHFSKMVGWESGDNIARFKPFYKVLGLDRSTNGVDLLALEYEDAALWLYHIDDIANVVYMEYGANMQDLSFLVQFDRAKSIDEELSGNIDSKTIGILVEYGLDKYTFSFAFNKELGSTGSMWSFGGGPFVTSMEDLTIDAIGSSSALAYCCTGVYNFDRGSIGISYGEFLDDANFHCNETDLFLEMHVNDHISIESVVANIDDKKSSYEDFNIYRVSIKMRY